MYAVVLSITLAATFLFVATECRWDLNEKNVHHIEPEEKRYTAAWAVEITEGGDSMADEMAAKYGFKNLGKVVSYAINNMNENLTIFL